MNRHRIRLTPQAKVLFASLIITIGATALLPLPSAYFALETWEIIGYYLSYLFADESEWPLAQRLITPEFAYQHIFALVIPVNLVLYGASATVIFFVTRSRPKIYFSLLVAWLGFYIARLSRVLPIQAALSRGQAASGSGSAKASSRG